MFKKIVRGVENVGKKLGAADARRIVGLEYNDAKAIENFATPRRNAMDIAAKLAKVTSEAQAIQAKLAPHQADQAFAASVNYMQQATDALAAMQKASTSIEASFQVIHLAPGRIDQLTKELADDLKQKAQAILKEALEAEVNFNKACTVFEEQQDAATRALDRADVSVNATLAQQQEAAAIAAQRQTDAQQLAAQQADVARQIADLQRRSQQLAAAQLAPHPSAAPVVVPPVAAHVVSGHSTQAPLGAATLVDADAHSAAGAAMLPGFTAQHATTVPLSVVAQRSAATPLPATAANQARPAAEYVTDDDEDFVDLGNAAAPAGASRPRVL